MNDERVREEREREGAGEGKREEGSHTVGQLDSCDSSDIFKQTDETVINA